MVSEECWHGVRMRRFAGGDWRGFLLHWKVALEVSRCKHHQDPTYIYYNEHTESTFAMNWVIFVKSLSEKEICRWFLWWRITSESEWVNQPTSRMLNIKIRGKVLKKNPSKARVVWGNANSNSLNPFAINLSAVGSVCVCVRYSHELMLIELVDGCCLAYKNHNITPHQTEPASTASNQVSNRWKSESKCTRKNRSKWTNESYFKEN